MLDRFTSGMLLPCTERQAPAVVSLAMQKISKILVEARKQEANSLGLRNLAAELQRKIQRERGQGKLHGMPDLYAHLPYFTKEFKLRKY